MAALGYGLTISGGSLGAITGIRALNGGDMTRTAIDVSTAASTGKFKEFLAGMIDTGSIGFDCVYDTTNYAKVCGAIDNAAETWTLTLSDTHTFVSSGFIESCSLPSANADGETTYSFSIKLSGSPTYT